MDAFASIRKVLTETEFHYALIGAYAVNVWLEPRFTADIDVVVAMQAQDVEDLSAELAKYGFKAQAQRPVETLSDPDFIRFKDEQSSLVVDVQLAKTEFQEQVIRRAKELDGLSVATVEDLVILKLIAYRTKDRIDLEGLIKLPDIDWNYVERWSETWGVAQQLVEIRKQIGP